MDEKEHGISGGIYNKLQVDFAYNSNHIEGSRLTHDQTRYIFETHTIETENGSAKVDDIIETINHFKCFDVIIESYNEPLTEEYIKNLHKILKTGTFSATSEEAVVGDYKKYPNEVGGLDTVEPESVMKAMKALLETYNNIESISFDDLLDFHAKYEKIHPFYDGNGRTGRLILFKECLKNNIIPFIIADEYKYEYNRGLHEWQLGKEKGYLRDTCLFMQDYMKKVLDYFKIKY